MLIIIHCQLRNTSTLGGVKVDGSTITIDGSGVISSSPGYTLPTASTTTLGGIKVGTGLSIDSSTGVLSAGTVSSSTLDGQILETLAGICDGRTVTVESGTYTLTNVSSTQNTTTSWVDVTGSSISYTPPSGTKQVIFEFHLSLSTDTDYGVDNRFDARAIILFKMLIDGTSVTSQNQEWGDNNYSWGDNFFYRGIIDITGTDSVSDGKLSSWTSSKTIKLQVISYAATYAARLHANRNGELPTSTSDVNTLIKPRMKITAIGQSSPQSAILPTASTTTLGGIKVDGSTITINGSGVISSSGGSSSSAADDITVGDSTVTINTTSGNINIGSNTTSSNNINIGTGAVARTVTIGNSTGATAVNIESGTGDITLDGDITLSGHIIPSSNASYDLGNAEYKIRHLFLSDNSLWVGDDHKIDISSGKMRFKKRKKNVVPASIIAASGTETDALLHAGIDSIENMKLYHWKAYANTLTGLASADIEQIFVSETAADWEDDIEAGGISYSVGDGGLTQNNFTDALKTKLDSLSNYTLPTATDSILGGVKVGTNLSIDVNGVLSATDTNTTYSVGDGGLTQNNFTDALKTKLDSLSIYTLTAASDSTLGGIKVGTNLSIDGDGVLSATDTNTTYSVGDGGLTQNNFTDTLKTKLDSLSNYTLPNSSTTTLGGVKVGTNLSIDGDGVLSANNSILTHNITIGDIGGNKYLFNNDTSEPQPTITLIKGMTYYFNLNISGHPFHLQTSGNGYNSSNSYTSHSSYSSGYLSHSSGVSDGSAQGKTSGILTFSVPYNAPDTLYYQCQYHSGMFGIFNIVNGNTLSTASTTTIGGIKVGTNLSIDSDGVLSATDTNTTYSVGDGGLTQNNFTDALKTKLDSLSNYTLVAASDSTLGGIKVGTNLSIDGNGVLSATDTNTTYSVGDGGLTQNNFTDTLKTKLDGIATSANNYSLPNASASSLGGIKVGTNLSIDVNGVLSATDTNTTYSVGDGGLTQKNFTDALKTKLDGIATSANNYSLPTSTSTLGGVKVDGSTITISDGVISSSGGGGSYTLPIASSSTLGGIKVGTGLSIDSSSGVLSAGTASSSTLDGQILETLAGVCDGRSVTVESGTYTLTNVDSAQNATTTFTDINGSSISYTPPSGTKQVIYEFEFQHAWDGPNGWGYYKFLLDGTQVGEIFEIGFDNYGSSWQKVSFVFEIGQNDLSNGKVLSWTSDKTIKLQFREHSSSNSQVRVHTAPNNGYGLIKPRIKIQAIGQSSPQIAILPTASTTTLGGIKVGTNLSIDGNGVLSATDTNTTYSVGDGGLTQNNFTDTLKTKLDSLSNYTLPTAASGILGGVKVGTNLSIDGNGVLSATDTNTTYSVGDGGLTQNNFTNALKSKLDGIATSADVTNENNAATATKLATARTIAGQSFDGSANITIALSDLSNVHTTAPSSNQVLTWDATNSRWAPADASGGGSSVWNTASGNDDINYTAGNVGIGTTSPDKYYYNASATGGSFTSTDRILAINGGTSGQNNGVARLVLSCDANHTASIFANHTGNGNTHMGFLTTSGTAAPVERMRINESGNVGIGTPNPNYTLQISDHGLGMGYNLGGTALFGYKSLGTTSYSQYKRGHEFLNANGDSMMCIVHYGTDYTTPKVGIGTTSPNVSFTCI